MALKLHPTIAAALCAAVTNAVDAAATPGKVLIYDGAEPANPTIAVTSQVLLASFTLPDPSFDAPTQEATGARAEGNLPAPAPALASGTASWGRLVDGDNNVILQGNATLMAGNGQFKLTSVDLVEDIDVALVAMSHTQPRGY